MVKICSNNNKSLKEKYLKYDSKPKRQTRLITYDVIIANSKKKVHKSTNREIHQQD